MTRKQRDKPQQPIRNNIEQKRQAITQLSLYKSNAIDILIESLNVNHDPKIIETISRRLLGIMINTPKSALPIVYNLIQSAGNIINLQKTRQTNQSQSIINHLVVMKYFSSHLSIFPSLLKNDPSFLKKETRRSLRTETRSRILQVLNRAISNLKTDICGIYKHAQLKRLLKEFPTTKAGEKQKC